MAPSPNDDLNWLYDKQQRPSDEPEPTRVLPPVPSDGPSAGPPTAVQPPVENHPQGGYPPPVAGPRPTARPAPQQRRPGGSGTPPPGPPPPGDGRRPGGPPPRGPGVATTRKRHPVRNSFRVIGVLLLVIIIGLIGVPIYAWNQVARVDEAPSGDRPADQPGTTFLLVGSDSRKGLTKEERKALGTGNTAGLRTDTLMILYVPVGGKPVLVSLPRDSYVPIPGNGRNKINAAYSFGGPKLMVQTVEQNTGLRIDGYVEVGFGGFVNVIDAMGGIEMCLDKAIKDKDSHINLPKGCQDLSGAQALGYVRMRKADPRGDLGRVERQRAMLAAMAKKGASPASALNPVRYWRLSTETAKSLTLGEDTNAREMLTFALGMRKVASGSGLTLTVPIANANAQTPAGSAVLWDEALAKEMFGEIARGDTSDLKKFAK